MARDIVIWPHKVLTTSTQPVTDFGPALEKLLEEMAEAMAEAKGIGIAANQVGEPLRVAIVGREDGTSFEIVNPQLLSKQGDTKLEEGCLSVPDVWEKCPRVERVKVRYQDKKGEWHELEAEGRLAHVLQHEIDHLDGHVFVDHLSSLKRGLILERMRKLQKSLARRKEEAPASSRDAKGSKRS
ncbi:peptide deformylase [Corallococcus llansteffanensis]|uniref:Peptide deformylase n=1 Tax=Corallococcus llansteffanensis TaxID=2316731 RepID=A0A3A8NTA4_9BACT|nr:peptide deformylase [Corallococcus llansteffanensis]RKH47263.1 peptide deformylase [Corallococcus llansteffanensis]